MAENTSVFEKNGDYYRTEDVRKLQESARELESVVNTLLEAGGYDNYRQVCMILKSDQAEVLFQVSKSLMVARIFTTVEELQLSKGSEVTVFCGRNLCELEALYQEIVFRLRRIEFEIEIDIKKDIFQFLIDEKLSVDVLIAVLQGTTYLYSKDKIWNTLLAESK